LYHRKHEIRKLGTITMRRLAGSPSPPGGSYQNPGN